MITHRTGSGANEPPFEDTMRHKTTQSLFDYWNDVRANRTAPRRYEIHPSRIPGILPDTFLLERRGSEAFHYRLAGTRICDAFGRELRGANFLDGWQHEDRRALIRHLTVVTEQCAAEIIHFEAGPDLKSTISFEIVMLPLIHTGDAVDRVLGSFCALEPADWLYRVSIDYKALTDSELLWPGWVPNSGATIGLVHSQDAQAGRGARSPARPFRVLQGGLSRTNRDDG